jgi:acetyl-CoA carboxylase biotin carboxyl carrier protein
MNLKEIQEVIKLMEEHNLSEIEIEKGDQKIKLRKTVKTAPGIPIEQPVAIQQFQQPELKAPQQDAKEASSKNLVEIKAPIVGTFYRSASPDAAPFVEIGQEIEIGQVVCIIEAMKLMNEIKSEVRGKVIDILVENSDPIEFGQILLLIEPS